MIWYVEDDASIRDIAIYALNSAGFETKGFEDGLTFWEALKKEKPELIVLDVMLPGMDGIEILSKMKDSMEYSRVPVIMATAKGQEYDRIRGLDLGADDYIVKPFSMMEMVSRVKAVLRRSQPQQVSKLLKVGGLVVNLDEHTVVETVTEFSLLTKNLNCFGCSFLIPEWFIPGSSCSLRCGNWITWVIPVLWIPISVLCARNWTATAR